MPDEVSEPVRNAFVGENPLDSDLLAALGWMGPNTGAQLIPNIREGLESKKLYISRQPAAFVLSGVGASAPEAVRAAALYCYHANLQWGLAVDPDEAILFNSYWVKDDFWYTLPPINRENVEQFGFLLDKFKPRELLLGSLTDEAFTLQRPDRILQPVDEDLVDRLDYWRSETLRYVKETEGADNDLQFLYAQLFLLRSVEDRDLRELPPLLSIITDAGVDRAALNALYQAAADQIQQRLFGRRAYERIPDHVLSGVIRDLYSPPNGRGIGLRYDFSWLEADVLGHAYEKYLSTVLVESAQPVQPGLFGTPLREIESVSKRKAAGVFYTPPEICRFLVEKTLDSIWREDDDFIPVIADIACGSGSFLDAGLDSLLRRLKLRDPDRNWANEIVARRSIRGMDIDEMAVVKTQNRLWLRLASEPNALPLLDLDASIVCGDSLSPTATDIVGNDVDVMVGNPPFLATNRVEARNVLAERFESARGRFDYSSLFIEQALRILRPGSTYGFVVPNRLLNNRDASPIRELLTNRSHVQTIVDFGSAQLFKGVNAYVGLIVGSFGEPAADASTLVIELADLPTHLPEVVLTELTQGIELDATDARVFETFLPRTGDPWLLLSPDSAFARVKLGEHEPLETYALVQQGIKTGANDIFVVRVVRASGSGIVEVVNGLGRTCLLEESLLRPVVSGPELRPHEEVRPTSHLLYTYKDGRRLTETELQERFPATWSYLVSHRSLLEARSSLSPGLHWYELIRPRLEQWLVKPKLLMRDLAPRISFAKDSKGGVFLIGGTAVIPEDGVQLISLAIYLNSSIPNWFLSTSASQFQGSYYRFDPGKLSKVPVPEQVAYDPEFRDRLVVAFEHDLQTPNIPDGALPQVDHLLLELLGLEAGILK